MKKMVDKKRYFAVLFLCVFFASYASASFILGNQSSSIDSVYGPSGNITGWVNMSFNSEPLSSTFSDSRDNSINLSGILSKNPGYDYSCNTLLCGDDYQASNPAAAKTISLDAGESRIYGIRLTGNVTGVDSIKFSITGTATASCTNQIEVDFLDDNSTDFRNVNAGDISGCSSLKNYGCFDQSQASEDRVIGSTPYCEQVNLSASPGFLLGAWITKFSGSSTINASLYDIFGQKVAECSLPDASAEGGEVSCNAKYAVTKPGQYYVCINSVSGIGVYTAKGYDSNCGFYAVEGIPASSFDAAYHIFAQGEQFGAVGTSEINESAETGESFSDLADQYLSYRYPGKDCTNGCILPIKVTSHASQTITLGSLQAKYEKKTGVLIESNLYDISATPAKITSDFQKLYLDGSGFSVPASLGNYSFSLKFNDQSLISKKVLVSQIPVISSLSPTETAAAYPTNFTVSASSKYSITGFYWDFGDNSSATTLSNVMMHTYVTTGTYNLKVTATDEKGVNGSMTFEVNVSSPKSLISTKLGEMKAYLSNIKNEISVLPKFYQDAIDNTLNLTYLNRSVIALSAAYANATTDADYSSIVSAIATLNIPSGVSKIATATSLPLMPDPSNVNLVAVEGIDGATFESGKEQGYINGVLIWQQDNINARFGFDQFYGRYSSYLNPLVNIYKVTVTEKKDIPYDYYLILPQFAGFFTSNEYNISNGYIYINLKSQNPVYFATTENLNLTALPIFISPSISQLSFVETLPEGPPFLKWVIFTIIAIVLFFIGALVYVMLGRWYDRRYENYLFKNRNDLFNMVTYVNNAKRKGMKNSEIAANLKKASWSAERVRYVMRKYAGKGTGMAGFNTKWYQRR